MIYKDAYENLIGNRIITDDELEIIKNSLLNGGNVIIYGPVASEKTALIKTIIKELEGYEVKIIGKAVWDYCYYMDGGNITLVELNENMGIKTEDCSGDIIVNGTFNKTTLFVNINKIIYVG